MGFRYPDTFLYNTADNAGFLVPQDNQNMMVSSNGTVFWPLPLAQLRTRCRMTIKHFPFGNVTEKFPKNDFFRLPHYWLIDRVLLA